MKTSKIGELIYGKFKTEFHATPEVKKALEKKKISLATLIPTAWLWYDQELLEVIDENGDGKPDKRFGKLFKVIYYSHSLRPSGSEKTREIERNAILISNLSLSELTVKFACLRDFVKVDPPKSMSK